MKNNENSFQTIAKTSLLSSYLGFTILSFKYEHPYLPTLPQKNLSKLFFWKKFGSKTPYLPTVWTYVQSFVVFLFGTLSLLQEEEEIRLHEVLIVSHEKTLTLSHRKNIACAKFSYITLNICL